QDLVEHRVLLEDRDRLVGEHGLAVEPDAVVLAHHLDHRQHAALGRQDRAPGVPALVELLDVRGGQPLQEADAVVAGDADVAPALLLDDHRGVLPAARRRSARRRSASAQRRWSSSVATSSGGTGTCTGRPWPSTATNVRYALVV